MRTLVPIAFLILSLAACSKKPAPAPATTEPPAPATTEPPAPATTEPPAPATTEPSTNVPSTAAPGDATTAQAPAAEPDAAPSEPAPGATCAEADTITLDLDSFVASFTKMHELFESKTWVIPPAEENGEPTVDHDKAPKFAPLLRQLGLDEPATQVDLASDAGFFDVFSCAITRGVMTSEPGIDDVLVTVECANRSAYSPADGETVHAAVLLRTLPSAGDGGRRLCRLGAVTAHDQVSGRPCLADSDGVPQWKASTVSLVAADRQSLRVDISSGSCGDGTLRGDSVSTTFYGVEGGKLVQYFEGVLDDVWYESPCPPTRGIVGKLELGEAYPKVIAYAREQVCTPAEDGCEADPGCVPAKGTETWTYVGGSYARQGAPALPEKPVAEPTSAADLAARARKAMKEKRWIDAIADLEAAMAIDAELPRLRGELGWALFSVGRLDDARTMTEAALAKSDKPASKGALHYNLGRIDEADGKRDQAIAHYKDSLAARPKNEVVQKRLDALLKAPK